MNLHHLRYFLAVARTGSFTGAGRESTHPDTFERPAKGQQKQEHGMSDIRFSEEHEWIRVDGDVGTCGITEFAQEQLGDIVYVELPEAGRQVAQNEEIAVVESVKAASELYAPVAGEVVDSNQALVDDPAKVNADAMGEGWFFKIRLSDPGQLDALMDEAAYLALVAEQA